MSSSLTRSAKLPHEGVFDPNEEQLVFNFLIREVSGNAPVKGFRYIRNIDIYEHEPSELPSLAHDCSDEKLYFFTPIRQRGMYVERLVPGGFWKETGAPTVIKGKDGKPVAEKTSLAYYKKYQTSESMKGQWLMEYMLLKGKQPHHNDQESRMLTPLALCVVYYKRHCKSESRNDTI